MSAIDPSATRLLARLQAMPVIGFMVASVQARSQ
jgi:hypothetical protein